MLKTPLIVVNLKTYEKGFGNAGLALCKDMESIAQESGVCIAAAVNSADIFAYSQATNIPILAQHIDSINFGAHTGHSLPEAVSNAGAIGTLINHAERQIDEEKISATISRSRDSNLTTILCTADIGKTISGAKLEPDMIAIEPPELIGGDISVSTANPEIISETVSKVSEISSNIKILCGAGVKTRDDVSKAFELGVDGILLASGVVLSDNPRKTLHELVLGIV